VQGKRRRARNLVAGGIVKLKLPHSQVAYDLAEAQELNDMFVALKRFLNSDFLDSLDIGTPYCRFTINFPVQYNTPVPGVFEVSLPFACTIEAVRFWSTWGGGPAGQLDVQIVANYSAGAAATASAGLTSAVPVATVNGLAVQQGGNEKLNFQGVAGAIPPVSLVSWGCSIDCKALVEVE
jgi:hypothetical protein